MIGATLTGRLKAGETLIGGWSSISSGFAAEILARSGSDWVCIDAQHGLATGESLVPMLQGLGGFGCPGVVRVRWNEPGAIMHALDAGAEGVIVPMVETASDAARAVGACRYPPRGYRSYGPTRAAVIEPAWGHPDADARALCAVMIETALALENLASIARTAGLDCIFVGPADLALSTVFDPTDFENPRFLEALALIVDQCRAGGLIPGIFAPTTDLAVRWGSLGYRLLAVQSDVRLLRTAATEAIARVRTELGLPVG